jgi:hypothetical protein
MIISAFQSAMNSRGRKFRSGTRAEWSPMDSPSFLGGMVTISVSNYPSITPTELLGMTPFGCHINSGRETVRLLSGFRRQGVIRGTLPLVG